MKEDAEWLISMLSSEIDLRPPFSIERELIHLSKDSTLLLSNQGGVAVGHAAIRKLGGDLEIITVVVDPSQRGRGISRKLIRELIESHAHGLRVHCWTRSHALSKVLLDHGFSRRLWPGLTVSFWSIYYGFIRVFTQLIRFELRRTLHQIIHLRNYKLYILD